jgi:hypothetical protein
VGEGGLIPGGFLKAELHDASFLADRGGAFFHYITKTAGLQDGSDDSHSQDHQLSWSPALAL